MTAVTRVAGPRRVFQARVVRTVLLHGHLRPAVVGPGGPPARLSRRHPQGRREEVGGPTPAPCTGREPRRERAACHPGLTGEGVIQSLTRPRGGAAERWASSPGRGLLRCGGCSRQGPRPGSRSGRPAVWTRGPAAPGSKSWDTHAPMSRSHGGPPLESARPPRPVAPTESASTPLLSLRARAGRWPPQALVPFIFAAAD